MCKDCYDKELVCVYDILNNETSKVYTYNEFITNITSNVHSLSICHSFTEMEIIK